MGQRLGQHFLKNKSKIKKIVDALELKTGDVVVEIGPGHGELTEEIATSDKRHEIKIIAIEKDKILSERLKEKFKDNNNIEIIEGDVLRVFPKLTTNYQLLITNLKLVGNVPYYITGKLLRILSELENKPSIIVLTIQKEVAQRICGQPPRMNLLAAITQFWAEPKIIEYISKNDFKPAPKVDGAIVALRPQINADYTQIDADKFYKFVKVLFKQPRKTIINNLRSITDNLQLLIEKLRSVGINKDDRPQNLTLEQIKSLSTLF